MHSNWLKIEKDGNEVVLKECSKEAEGELDELPDLAVPLGEARERVVFLHENLLYSGYSFVFRCFSAKARTAFNETQLYTNAELLSLWNGEENAPHKYDYANPVNVLPATCKTAGSYETVTYCTVCGEELSRKTVIVPATGHEDTDNDGKCDLCSEKMTGADICPLCGKVHYSNTFF